MTTKKTTAVQKQHAYTPKSKLTARLWDISPETARQLLERLVYNLDSEIAL